jgi:hypothetical protein
MSISLAPPKKSSAIEIHIDADRYSDWSQLRWMVIKEVTHYAHFYVGKAEVTFVSVNVPVSLDPNGSKEQVEKLAAWLSRAGVGFRISSGHVEQCKLEIILGTNT